MTAETSRTNPTYQIANHVRSASCPDSGMVLDIEHGRMFHLNHVASRMLELVKNGLREPEIVASIAQEFGIGFETAAHDVRGFLETLERLGVIEQLPVKLLSQVIA